MSKSVKHWVATDQNIQILSRLTSVPSNGPHEVFLTKWWPFGTQNFQRRVYVPIGTWNNSHILYFMKGSKALASHIYSIFAAIKASFETHMNFEFFYHKRQKKQVQPGFTSGNKLRILGNTHEPIYAKNWLPQKEVCVRVRVCVLGCNLINLSLLRALAEIGGNPKWKQKWFYQGVASSRHLGYPWLKLYISSRPLAAELSVRKDIS